MDEGWRVEWTTQIIKVDADWLLAVVRRWLVNPQGRRHLDEWRKGQEWALKA